MQELWKDVVGYETYFEISNLGRLKSKRTSKILSQTKSKTGYFTHATKIGGRKGKCICFKIHRLVAEAFIPNPENKPFVNHKDGNKLNNKEVNLEWNTGSENIKHAFEHGLSKPLRGDKNPHAKLTEPIVKQIKFEYEFTDITHRELAKKYGVGKTTIQNVLANERWNNSV